MTHGNTKRDRSIRIDVHQVKVGRRYWHFTFSDAWGPLLTDEWAEPVDQHPLVDEDHPFWDAFEVWQKANHPVGAREPQHPQPKDESR